MLSGTLTVQENIALSAALRLPRDFSRGERKEKVDEIMEELNLTHVAKSKVMSSTPQAKQLQYKTQEASIK